MGDTTCTSRAPTFHLLGQHRTLSQYRVSQTHVCRQAHLSAGFTGPKKSNLSSKSSDLKLNAVSLMLAPHAESVLAITQCIRSTGRIRDVDVGLGGVKVGDVEREHDFVAPLRPFAVWRFHHDAGPPHCVSH